MNKYSYKTIRVGKMNVTLFGFEVEKSKMSSDIPNGYDYSASKRSKWLKLLYLAATNREISSRISIYKEVNMCRIVITLAGCFAAVWGSVSAAASEQKLSAAAAGGRSPKTIVNIQDERF